MALTEDVSRDEKGRLRTGSFMTYKLPTRLDVPEPRVEFMPSFEPTGPFGAKSIGEVVINTPSPAVMSAVPTPRVATCATCPSCRARSSPRSSRGDIPAGRRGPR